MLFVSVILVWTFKSFLEFRGLALSDISFVLTNRSSPWRICLRFWHVNCCDSQVILTIKSPVWGNQVISSVLPIVWLHINWVWQSGRQFCQQSLSQPVHWLWPVMSISVSHGFRGQTFRGSYKHTVFVKKGWVELLSRLLSRWPPPFVSVIPVKKFDHSCLFSLRFSNCPLSSGQ